MQEFFSKIGATLSNFLKDTGVAILMENDGWWKTLLMYAIVIALFYLAIAKKYEPLLLLPIAFGILLANLPGADLLHMEIFTDGSHTTVGETIEAVFKNPVGWYVFPSSVSTSGSEISQSDLSDISMAGYLLSNRSGCWKRNP